MKKGLLFILLAAFSATLFARDDNAQGFNHYKKKRFAKAQKLFLKSTQKNPKNLYGWYNMARTTYILKG